MSIALPPNDPTRDAIHTAARRVFARRGAHHAAMDEIATQAGISLDTLHQYYATEDDLLRDIIAAWATQAAPVADAAQTAGRTRPSAQFPSLPADPSGTRMLSGISAPVVDHADHPEDTTVTPAHPSRSGSPVIEENRTIAMDMSRLTELSTPPHSRRGATAPLYEIVRSAVTSLSTNKMRSILTMLGIIIGVASVVGLLALGSGVSGYIQGNIESNGANVVTIQGSSAVVNGVATGQRYDSITYEDAKALSVPGAVPDAAAVSPEAQRSGAITAGSVNAFATINGASPAYTTVHNTAVTQGDFISDTEVTGNANVIVLGPSLATNLFGSDDPIGKSVQVTGKSFNVIGVMESKSGGFNSPDAQAYVPITTALAELTTMPKGVSTVQRGKVIDSIVVKASSEATVNSVTDEVTDAMNARHGAHSGTNPDFEITTQTQLLNTVKSTLSIIQLFLVAVAGISLLVGGIGIMNIMLVSVTERTREIGVRKAIGAQEGTILTQFVIEATLISAFGAVIGVIFGCVVAFIASALWRPCTVSVTSIVVAMSVSVAIGVIFGAYPARRAARLKPIDALRYE